VAPNPEENAKVGEETERERVLSLYGFSNWNDRIERKGREKEIGRKEKTFIATGYAGGVC